MRRAPCLEREAGWPGEAGPGFLALGPVAGKAKRGGGRSVVSVVACCAPYLFTRMVSLREGKINIGKATPLYCHYQLKLNYSQWRDFTQSLSVSPFLQSSVSLSAIYFAFSTDSDAWRFVEVTAAARQRAVPIACRNHTLVETASRRLLNF